MNPHELVNEPNIRYRESLFRHREYVTHQWCNVWLLAERRHGEPREPMFVMVNQGPVRCEFCGRRASRFLRKLIIAACDSSTYDSTYVKGERLTYYQLQRSDLEREGLEAWALTTKLVEELL